MADYIEREAIMEKSGWYNLVNGKSIHGVQDYEIASIPSANVKPVVYAEWSFYGGGVMCSACGLKIPIEKHILARCQLEKWWMKFCPECGADIKEGEL